MSDEIRTQASELCDQIKAIYPEIGECGVDVEVWHDDAKKTWRVRLSTGEHELTTHIEPDDVTACLEGRQCLHLGVQIEQLIKNVRA